MPEADEDENPDHAVSIGIDGEEASRTSDGCEGHSRSQAVDPEAAGNVGRRYVRQNGEQNQEKFGDSVVVPVDVGETEERESAFLAAAFRALSSSSLSRGARGIVECGVSSQTALSDE
jgi:hypothetical protein